MAARRGRSQARRNTGNGGGLPGWAWLVLGLLLGIGAILAAPRLLKSDGDGFFRPRPNPDAQPVGGALVGEDDAIAPEDGNTPDSEAGPEVAKEPDFDFYTVLPGEEFAMTDAQLAATAREEAARQERQQRQQQTLEAAAQAGRAAAIDAGNGALPPPVATTPSTAPGNAAAATTASATSADARYILQAGAFGASGDAEELKARIALIGLGARVESASINGKTMYRVRMGPYGTASELAAAKAKLGSNGLPAMAIRAK
ncbi:MAG: SPOR domain-containing protein [Pseudomonadota bacterium]|nr:SPOR domain-containing protein [Pseudomonadota bacterium]